MALKHKGVGSKLTQAEWESEDLHELAGHSAASIIVISDPPSGKCRILNIYYDPVLEKAIFKYEDTPIA